MEKNNLRAKIYMSKLIIAAFVTSLVSCAGSAPSISGFMNPKSEVFMDAMSKSGDLYQEESTYEDAYYDESDEEINIGTYFTIKNIAFGSEFGTSGFKPVLGLKNDYVGTLAWLSFDPTGATTTTYGAAIAEQYPFTLLDSALRLGVYEYMNRSAISSFENQEMFRVPAGYKSYFESGLGIYGVVSIMKTVGFAAEYKIGRQIKTHEVRRYLNLKAFYSFSIEK